MDGEWPITLQQDESEAEYAGYDQMEEQYQADRGSDKDLPGGKEQHDRRTEEYRRQIEKEEENGNG